MAADITDILREWEFDSDNQIRIIQADDGRQVLQVRQPMGIEQYELDGRPDGKKPFGRDSALEEFQAQLENYRSSHGSTEGFALSHEDFAALQAEGVLFYFRYLVLYQIGDFVRTARDTDHNLSLFRLVEQFGDSDDDRKELLQYKPYVLRMKSAAEDILQAAISAIEDMGEIDTPAFQFERVRSLNYLKATLKQIHDKKDSPTEVLKTELQQAVEAEDYEQAAALRDRIRAIDVSEPGENGPLG
jgi:hypothetical protein